MFHRETLLYNTAFLKAFSHTEQSGHPVLTKHNQILHGFTQSGLWTHALCKVLTKQKTALCTYFIAAKGLEREESGP